MPVLCHLKQFLYLWSYLIYSDFFRVTCSSKMTLLLLKIEAHWVIGLSVPCQSRELLLLYLLLLLLLSLRSHLPSRLQALQSSQKLLLLLRITKTLHRFAVHCLFYSMAIFILVYRHIYNHSKYQAYFSLLSYHVVNYAGYKNNNAFPVSVNY